jgi:hypothetical protein
MLEPIPFAGYVEISMTTEELYFYNKGFNDCFAKGLNPAKTLTDEEIKIVMALDECWIGEDCSTPNMIAFARAILRKAQEK